MIFFRVFAIYEIEIDTNMATGKFTHSLSNHPRLPEPTFSLLGLLLQQQKKSKLLQTKSGELEAKANKHTYRTCLRTLFRGFCRIVRFHAIGIPAGNNNEYSSMTRQRNTGQDRTPTEVNGTG